jgi:hypothetical protein
MLFFYLFACVPMFIGALLWFFNRRIVLQEWIGSTVVAFMIAGITHLIAVKGMTGDIETFSGEILYAKQFSAWREFYEEAIYRTETYTTTDSNGNTTTHTRLVFSHWEDRRRWHEANWWIYSNIDTKYQISSNEFIWYCKVFNDRQTVAGKRRTGEHNSKMIDGDPNDYEAHNKTGYIKPVTDKRHWKNKVKAAPSVFSFVKVPTNAPVYNWPENPNPFESERVLGTARQVIPKLEWDRMNAKLGPSKRVNVIIIGFGDQDSSVAHLQQAKWIGGKKNDLVITYGGPNEKPRWSFVFGWTERETVKKNLQTIILDNGVSTNTIPLIKQEISTNYKIKDWSKFDYLKVEPPKKAYIWFLSIMIIVQVGLYILFHLNDFDKDEGIITISFLKELKKKLKKTWNNLKKRILHYFEKR